MSHTILEKILGQSEAEIGTWRDALDPWIADLWMPEFHHPASTFSKTPGKTYLHLNAGEISTRVPVNVVRQSSSKPLQSLVLLDRY